MSNSGLSTANSISTPGRGVNRQWRLKAPIPIAELVDPSHFDLVESSLPRCTNQQFLIRTVCLGTSPAQRAYVTLGQSMHNKVGAGELMRGRGVGVVVESQSDYFAQGALVIANTGWQDYSVHHESDTGMFGVSKIANPVAPSSISLGILGSAGLTAYFGLIDVGGVSNGDTVLVSAAAGGVGSCAVQIAKVLGCRVIGVAGGADKCRWLTDTLGVDVAIDYKSNDLNTALQQHCPNGVDVYFDNVGGGQLDAAFSHIAKGARVVICGYISTDYGAGVVTGPSNYTQLLSRRARMEGFFVFDYFEQFPAAQTQLYDWFKQGLLVDTSAPLFGLERMPLALQSLFSGGNKGVRVCQVMSDSLIGAV